MVALPPGGGRRTSTLGTGSSRSTSVAIGAAGRGKTIATPSAFGTAFGLAVVVGISDFVLSGNALLQENGDDLLQETGERLLLEDGAVVGTATGGTTVRGIGASFRDAVGSVTGVASVAGVLEEPGLADNILKEDGDDILLETGDFLLKESGTVIPPTAILDVDGFAITDTTGDYILEP